MLGILQSIWNVKPFFIFDQPPVGSVSLKDFICFFGCWWMWWLRPPELHVPSALCGGAGMICLGAVIVAFRPALVISTTGGARKNQTNALTLRLINLIHCKFSPILNDKSMKISLNSVVLFSHTFLSAPLHYYLAKKSNLKLQIKKKKKKDFCPTHLVFYFKSNIFF